MQPSADSWNGRSSTSADERGAKGRNIIAWALFGGLFVIPTYVIAIIATIRSGLFSFGPGPITDGQIRTISLFLGSAVTGAVTLLGILFTAAQNRRSVELQRESEMNRERLAAEEDRRIRLESVAKGLELLTDGSGYAKKARVAGALATIVRLGHTSVALRTLESAWADAAVDANSATWLIDQVLKDGNSDEVGNAATILFKHAPELAERIAGGMILYLPDRLQDNWDVEWPTPTKIAFLGTLTRVLLSQEPKSWHPQSLIFRTIWQATKDDDEIARRTAAAIFVSFVRTTKQMTAILGDITDMPDIASATLSRLRAEGVGPNWFHRTPEMVDEVERWQQGAATWPDSWKPAGRGAP